MIRIAHTRIRYVSTPGAIASPVGLDMEVRMEMFHAFADVVDGAFQANLTAGVVEKAENYYTWIRSLEWSADPITMRMVFWVDAKNPTSNDIFNWVEYGTGVYGPKHTEIVPKKGMFMKFVNSKGEWIVTESVKGISPRLFLTKAVHSVYHKRKRIIGD